jgi:hypothetical protein
MAAVSVETILDYQPVLIFLDTRGGQSYLYNIFGGIFMDLCGFLVSPLLGIPIV